LQIASFLLLLLASIAGADAIYQPRRFFDASKSNPTLSIRLWVEWHNTLGSGSLHKQELWKLVFALNNELS
jgi:hypothetical protein